MVYLKSTEEIHTDGDLPIRQTLDKAYLLFFEVLESITLNELVYMESK